MAEPAVPTRRRGIREPGGTAIIGERWQLDNEQVDTALAGLGALSGQGSGKAAELLKALRAEPENEPDAEHIIDDPEYGEEVEIALLNGAAIRTGAGKPGEPLFSGSYIRIVNADGTENGYWHCDEWEDEPLLVMGAILASASGRELRRPTQS